MPISPHGSGDFAKVAQYLRVNTGEDIPASQLVHYIKTVTRKRLSDEDLSTLTMTLTVEEMLRAQELWHGRMPVTPIECSHAWICLSMSVRAGPVFSKTLSRLTERLSGGRCSTGGVSDQTSLSEWTNRSPNPHSSTTSSES